MTNVTGFSRTLSWLKHFSAPQAGALALFALSVSLPSLAASGETAGEVVSTEGVVFIRPDGAPLKAQAGIKPAKPGDLVRANDVINTSSNGKIKVLMKDKSIVDLGPSALFKVEGFAANGGKDRQIDVSMMYGTLRTAVTQKIEGKGRFRVRTPTATMGVRGTEFIVKTEMGSLEEIKQGAKAPEKPVASNAANPKGPPAANSAANASGNRTQITVIQGEVAVAPKESPLKSLGRAPSSELSDKAVSLKAGMQVSTSAGSSEGAAQMSKPVTLDSKQLASVASSAKVSDNTFLKAIVIDVPKQDGGKEFPGAAAATATGAATLEAVKNMIADAPPPILPPIDFTHPVDVFNPVPVSTQAGNKRLRVIVVMP